MATANVFSLVIKIEVTNLNGDEHFCYVSVYVRSCVAMCSAKVCLDV